MTPCRPQRKPLPGPRPACVATQLACVRCCSSRSPTWPQAPPSRPRSRPAPRWPAGSLPLSVVFALVACLLCAWCIGLLAREMPAAGSLATYAARGLHPAVGLPGRLGLRPGRLADPAAGAAAARVHHGVHDQRRVPRLPGEPVVAVVAGRRGDRARRRLLRRPDLGRVRHHPRDFRDRGLPGAGRVLRGARGQPQHRAGLHHALLPHRADRRDRRLGVHAARVRRLRGRRAAGRGGQGPAAHHPGARCCWPRC